MMGTIAPPAARALARLHEAGFEAWLAGYAAGLCP